MGHISFLMIGHNRKFLPQNKHCWEIDLSQQDPPIPNEVIDLIRNSKLNNFSETYQRAGVVFYPNSPHLMYTHICVDHFIPVWIYWGLKSYSEVNYNVYLNMEKYNTCPERVQAEFERIRQCQLHDAMSAWDEDTGPPAPPMPEPGSGQWIGELPWDYLERRAFEIANYFQNTDT